jgi:hypothetical protein
LFSCAAELDHYETLESTKIITVRNKISLAKRPGLICVYPRSSAANFLPPAREEEKMAIDEHR